MSLCDVCTRPGACCSGFLLNGGDWGKDLTALEVLVKLALAYNIGFKEPDRVDAGLPFIPMYRNEKGMWRFWCPNLQDDGRCGIYQDRPNVCRDYDACDDTLCVLTKNELTKGLATLCLPAPSFPS